MKHLVQVFAKAPEPGRTKTRLIPLLGAEGAAALHARMARDTLQCLTAHPDLAVELWCHPHDHHPFFEDCRRRFDVPLFRQRGGELGARMDHALHHGLDRQPHALLVGTDCPGLRADDLLEAGRALQAGADAVLGPALDGGYYLIGLRRPRPRLFRDMPWGSARVLDLTRHRLRQAGLRWHELTPRADVDRPEDLRHYPHLAGAGDAPC